ncbi:MAG: hypothetical protein K2I70_02375 [Bacilli bacterium]|nr:hypothetical protein [Bacilli bacterium]
MHYRDNCFDIYYTSSDEDYIEEVINTLNTSLGEYLDFFNLDRLDHKVSIKFYDNLESFKEYYESVRNTPHKSGHVGITRNNEIHMLSLRERLKERPQDNFEIFLMGVKHELVHICHIAYKGNNKGSWLAEGLATYLGSPRYEETIEGCTLEDLKVRSKYKFCYTLTKYLIEHYSHEKVLEYAADETLLLEDTRKILEEAKSYYSKKVK